MSNLIAVCASAFLAGVAAIVLAANARLPRLLRVASYVAGACGVLAGFFFPLFLFRHYPRPVASGGQAAGVASRSAGLAPLGEQHQRPRARS
jgi:hypothetical protein